MAVGNELGAVCLWDGENPRSFTGTAAEVISGGQFVYVSGASATAQVGSQASSFVTSDLAIKTCDTFGVCNGIALTNTATNGIVTIATRGNYLLKSAGPVSGGMLVTSIAGADAIAGAGVTDVGSWAGVVGRALTNAGSEDYCLVSLNL